MVCLHCARKCFCFVLLQVGHRLWYIELTIIIDFRFASHQLAKPIPNAQCSKQTNTICTCKLRFACWVLKNWLTCFSIGNEEVLHEPGNNTEGMCSVRKAKTTALCFKSITIETKEKFVRNWHQWQDYQIKQQSQTQFQRYSAHSYFSKINHYRLDCLGITPDSRLTWWQHFDCTTSPTSYLSYA